ncbi:hypothetical protein [Meridianimarinicoccus aquatilis]|uniref:Uncharacterized protein n=1 Tax=Meridianimarinicoccus aquatilis TaxID=2552766 RepID=A0A4R6APP3_9RHOB|nr:hypothetical protein [Fluviibacterium aquatile]TDL85422.1 hypothetical protein E2L05_15655 [Fluviibacterium aquatile]
MRFKVDPNKMRELILSGQVKLDVQSNGIVDGISEDDLLQSLSEYADVAAAKPADFDRDFDRGREGYDRDFDRTVSR